MNSVGNLWEIVAENSLAMQRLFVATQQDLTVSKMRKLLKVQWSVEEQER